MFKAGLRYCVVLLLILAARHPDGFRWDVVDIVFISQHPVAQKLPRFHSKSPQERLFIVQEDIVPFGDYVSLGIGEVGFVSIADAIVKYAATNGPILS